jgi:hypothetical protein
MSIRTTYRGEEESYLATNEAFSGVDCQREARSNENKKCLRSMQTCFAPLLFRLWDPHLGCRLNSGLTAVKFY